LENEGLKVTVASSSLAESKGMLGTVVRPDILLGQIKVDDYDIVIFVGGIGAREYFNDSAAHEIAREAVRKKKVLGAICIAPVTLANSGVLKGKKATVWSSEGGLLERHGAHYTGKPVEVDGMIVTADGPKAAREFGAAIVSCFKKGK
jgi:protease I